MRLLGVRIGLLCTGSVVLVCVASAVQGHNRAKSEEVVPKILVNSVQLIDFGEINQSVKTLEQPTCANSRDSELLTVANLVGGKVKVIRVTRTLRLKNSPKKKKLKETLRKVWRGKFQGADCRILWDEVVLWSIQSVLEFEDGKKGTLLTDGLHVALQDHDGKVWFFRLMPGPTSRNSQLHSLSANIHIQFA
jgi:hypothetical protein